MTDFERQIADALKEQGGSFDPPPSLRQRVLENLPPQGGGGWYRRFFRRGSFGVFGIVALLGAGLGAGLGAADAIDLVDERVVVLGRDAVPFFDCPDGSPLGEFHRGDRVFAVARDAAGDWVLVRSPEDANGRVWVATRYVIPDGSLDDLIVTSCGDGESTIERGEVTEPTTTTATTTTPRGTTTTVPDGTTTTTPEGTTTTTPKGTTTTQPADTTGPSIGSGNANPSEIEENGSDTPCSPINSSVSVSVSDASGVDSVVVAWEVGTESGSKSMTISGSTATATIGNFPDDTIPPSTSAPIELTVTATDAHGNTTTKQLATSTLTLRDCTFT